MRSRRSAVAVAKRRILPPSSWPDATNTGIAGVGLTPDDLTLHGSDWVNIPANTTFQNYRVNGMLRVSTANVIIRNCYINSNDFWGVDADGSTNLLIEDCTFIGTVQGNACVLDGGGGGTYRRLNISGAQDGAKMNTNALMEDCYIHDLSSTAESHNDGIQFGTANGITIRHNYIDSRDTSAILMGGGEARVRAINCLIENNYLNGGGYNFYGPTAPDGGTNVSGGPSVNIQVLNNTFGPIFGNGRVTQWEAGLDNSNVFSGNVDHLGAPVNP